MGLIKLPETPKLDDLVNVPGLPDIPDADGILGPGVTDFENFSIFAACTEKQAQHSAKALKLQSVILTARVLIENIRVVLRPMLGLNNELVSTPMIGELNVDLAVGKITDPKVQPLPKCLADTFTADLINSSDTGIISDVIGGVNDALSFTNSAFDSISSMADSLTSDIESGIREVTKFIEKTMGSIIASGDKTLFMLLDKIQMFIDGTSFLNVYREFLESLNCIRENCAPLDKFLIDDSFLYYDDEKRRFIMPVDTNSGRIRLSKMFEDLNREELRQAQIIERRYYKYLSDKKEVLRNASLKTKSTGVSDGANPFAASLDYLESMSSGASKTISNLF